MTSTRHEHEPGIDDALRTLRQSVDVPPVNPAREELLLAAFDARWTRRSHASHWRTLVSAAALIALTVTLNWFVVRNAPRATPIAANHTSDLSGFATWPGADALPPFESGSLVRMDIPVSALPSLGLEAPAWATSVVPADIIVGQDGFARAFRLVQ